MIITHFVVLTPLLRRSVQPKFELSIVGSVETLMRYQIALSSLAFLT